MEIIPIMKKCTAHYSDGKNPKSKICRNCGGNIYVEGTYKDGYHQIFTMPNGQKIGFSVDTIK